MDKLRYFFKEALKNIWANRMMSLASVSILTVCLILLGSSLLVSMNLNSIIKQIESQNQIMVFLDPKLTPVEIDSIGDKINSIENVRQSVFISKSEALLLEKQTLGKNSDLLSGLENDNPLPNSYRIVLKDMASYASTVSRLEKIQGITDVKQNSGTAEKLNQINRVVGIIGIWLFAILAVISLFIISNTIKLAMYVRKREVNIMKFVGATDWFIRWPFILEGCLLGIISGLLAFAIQWYIYLQLIARAVSGLNLIKLVYFDNMFVYFGLGFVGAGLIVGVAGSTVSVRKYLRV